MGTILPQKTRVSNDRLVLNKVVLREMSFDELQHSKKMVVDLFDNEILGLFYPQYIGNDKIELMPLKILIKTNDSSIHVQCELICAKIIFLFREMLNVTSMRFESVIHKVCTLQNVLFARFVAKYQNVFDCNAVDDHFQNALHILCNASDANLEMFNLVLHLKDLDVNHSRFDGKTPFKLLESNFQIETTKKNEMLKQISIKSSYRPYKKSESTNKIKNVLF